MISITPFTALLLQLTCSIFSCCICAENNGNTFRVSDCWFEDVSGFIRKECRRNGQQLYQCPGTQELYELYFQTSDYYEGLSIYCPEDKYFYSACYLPFFTPLMFNNTVVAVRGHYVCNYFGQQVYSGEFFTQLTWCNNMVECYKGGVDEKYCNEDEEMFI